LNAGSLFVIQVIDLAGKRMKKISLLITVILLAACTGCISPTGTSTGCGGPSAQGWSGFASENGIIYFGSVDGDLLAVNPSARSRGLSFPSNEGEWISTEVKSAAPAGGFCGPMLSCGQGTGGTIIYSSPVVSEKYVYIPTYSGNDGQLYSLFLDTGVLWQIYPRQGAGIGKVVGNIVLDNGTIYITSSNGSVYAIEAENVVKKWETKITDQRIWTSPAVSDGVVYVGSYDGTLNALDAENGTNLWQKELPTSMASSPVCYEDTLLYGGFDRYLYALDKDDGSLLWRFKGENWFWAAPVVEGTTVYAACLDKTLYALDLTTGKELWRFTIDDPIVARPVLTGNRLVIVSESGELHSLDKNSGSSLQQISIDATIMAPLYAEGDTVYVHAREHKVYAIDIQEGTMLWEFDTRVE
jgi:outer membrane protein assembly factor BamB